MTTPPPVPSPLHEPEEPHVKLPRGRFDEGQASDADLAEEVRLPHGRFDEGERTGTSAVTPDEPIRGRFDEGQVSDDELAEEVRLPHGRFDEGERTTPPGGAGRRPDRLLTGARSLTSSDRVATPAGRARPDTVAAAARGPDTRRLTTR